MQPLKIGLILYVFFCTTAAGGLVEVPLEVLIHIASLLPGGSDFLFGSGVVGAALNIGQVVVSEAIIRSHAHNSRRRLVSSND
jgi:hypothetical protein